MKKVISFSLMLMVGLVLSQMMPAQLGEYYNLFREGIGILLGVCLAFIMINVGREFEIDKANVRGYAKDYFVAMFAAAVPWLLIALYYIYVLLPSSMWGDGDVWKETLLLSRYAAPTSAGILFAMLAALSLQKSWIYQKIQVLAIFVMLSKWKKNNIRLTMEKSLRDGNVMETVFTRMTQLMDMHICL